MLFWRPFKQCQGETTRGPQYSRIREGESKVNWSVSIIIVPAYGSAPRQEFSLIPIFSNFSNIHTFPHSVFMGVMRVMQMESLGGLPLCNMMQLAEMIREGNDAQQKKAIVGVCLSVYYVVDYFHNITVGTKMSTVFGMLCERNLKIGQTTLLTKGYRRNGVYLTKNLTTAQLFTSYLWKGDNGMKKKWKRQIYDNSPLYPVTTNPAAGRRKSATFYVKSKDATKKIMETVSK